MSTINQYINIFFLCSIGNFTHRHFLANPVYHVCNLYHFCFGSKSIGVLFYQIIFIFAGQFQIYPNQFYAFSFFTLFPGANHVGIILFGKHHFITGF